MSGEHLKYTTAAIRLLKNILEINTTDHGGNWSYQLLRRRLGGEWEKVAVFKREDTAYKAMTDQPVGPYDYMVIPWITTPPYDRSRTPKLRIVG